MAPLRHHMPALDTVFAPVTGQWWPHSFQAGHQQLVVGSR